jgi:penicillin-binding protein 1A
MEEPGTPPSEEEPGTPPSEEEPGTPPSEGEPGTPDSVCANEPGTVLFPLYQPTPPSNQWCQ